MGFIISLVLNRQDAKDAKRAVGEILLKFLGVLGVLAVE
jgi:hypothetical protein